MANPASFALQTPSLANPSVSLSRQGPPLLSAFSVYLLPRRKTPYPLVFVVSAALDSKPTVLNAEKLGEAGLELLKDFSNVDCSYNLTAEELRTKNAVFDALTVRSGTKVSREIFEASGGRLKVVGRAGVGIDNVDLAVAIEHGFLVVNVPTVNTVAAAEHRIALLTAMARNAAQADASVKAGKWQRSKYVGASLVGKTLAVLTKLKPFVVLAEKLGRVKDGVSHLTKVGSFKVDVSLEGNIILCWQFDQPGLIGKVGSILGEENVNVSFMNVGQIAAQKQAALAIGVDDEPSSEALKKIGQVPYIEDFVFLKL